MKFSCSKLYVLLFPLFFLTQPPAFAAEPSSRDLALETVSKLEKSSGVRVGTYRALIIGINDYKDADIDDLITAENDAKTLAGLLKKDYGFEEVMLLIGKQALRSKIIEEFRRLGRESKKNDAVLIYYAGHGNKDDMVGGYWASWDADPRDSSTFIAM